MARRVVVGMYEDTADARDAIEDLVDAGFDRNNISLTARDIEGRYGEYEGDEYRVDEDSLADGAGWGAVIGGLIGLGVMFIPGVGPILAAGPIVSALAGAGIGAAAGGLLGALVDAGIPEEDAEMYAEGVRRGGTMVMVKTTDDKASRAVEILNDHNPIDVDRRAQQWRETGWEGYDAEAEPYTAMDVEREREMYEREFDEDVDTDTLPIAEEEMRVGKREVSTGGVRVRTHVVEEPVERDVHLRDERVEVERRKVDRDVTDDDDVFKEGTIEMTGKAEEVVVDKSARVTEEITLDKEVDERTETIRETLRHTEVEIEEIDPEMEAEYEEHYGDTFGQTGREYEYYEPAYRYGYAVRSNKYFEKDNWESVEPEMRRDWERRHPDSVWEDVKDAVREGWNSVTD